MLLVFFLLGAILTIISIIYLLLLSDIKIQINRLQIRKNEVGAKVEILIGVGIYLFNRFKIIEFTIDNKKLKKLYQSGKLDIKRLRDHQKFNKDSLKTIKKLKFNIEQFKLVGNIGTENAILTSFISVLIHSMIAILVIPKIKDKRNYYENVMPVYLNQNIVNLTLYCIINIKIVHIINIIYIYLKKESVKSHERTSHRRTYAYSHE